jgi:hypothetical protein
MKPNREISTEIPGLTARLSGCVGDRQTEFGAAGMKGKGKLWGSQSHNSNQLAFIVSCGAIAAFGQSWPIETPNPSIP